jgi:hypothetical protein
MTNDAENIFLVFDGNQHQKSSRLYTKIVRNYFYAIE